MEYQHAFFGEPTEFGFQQGIANSSLKDSESGTTESSPEGSTTGDFTATDLGIPALQPQVSSASTSSDHDYGRTTGHALHNELQFRRDDEVYVKTTATVGDQCLPYWYRGKVTEISQGLYENGDCSRNLLPCYKIRYKGCTSTHDEWLFADVLMTFTEAANRTKVAVDNRCYKAASRAHESWVTKKSTAPKRSQPRQKKTPKAAPSAPKEAGAITRSQLVRCQGKRPLDSLDVEQESAGMLPDPRPQSAQGEAEARGVSTVNAAKRVALDVAFQPLEDEPRGPGTSSIAGSEGMFRTTPSRGSSTCPTRDSMDTDGGPAASVSDDMTDVETSSSISSPRAGTAATFRPFQDPSVANAPAGLRHPGEMLAAELDSLVRFKLEKADEMRKLELKEKEAEWNLIRSFLDCQTQRDEQRELERRRREEEQKTYRTQLETLVRALGGASSGSG